ncbi:MAG: hypothetical protein WC010_02065 [Candidatus Absconditabacterales bacterium]
MKKINVILTAVPQFFKTSWKAEKEHYILKRNVEVLEYLNKI